MIPVIQFIPAHSKSSEDNSNLNLDHQTEMVMKRKINTHAACINPKNIHVAKKPPTKVDLNSELKLTKDDLKLTKDLNDALLEEVQNNEKEIEILKQKEKKQLKAIDTLKLEIDSVRLSRRII